jgi:large subunit ribosomal protein L17
MRHAVDHRKLRRDPAHRKALLRNMMNALVKSERIETTVAKAKELRRLADKIITLGKRNTLHARRQVFSLLSDKANTDKVFAGLAGRFDGRAGGYTRIVRTTFRAGDGAEMAILEYLPAEEKKAARKGTKKTAAGAAGARRGKAAKEKAEGKPEAKSDEKKAAPRKRGKAGEAGAAGEGAAPAKTPRPRKKAAKAAEETGKE